MKKNIFISILVIGLLLSNGLWLIFTSHRITSIRFETIPPHLQGIGSPIVLLIEEQFLRGEKRLSYLTMVHPNIDSDRLDTLTLSTVLKSDGFSILGPIQINPSLKSFQKYSLFQIPDEEDELIYYFPDIGLMYWEAIVLGGNKVDE